MKRSILISACFAAAATTLLFGSHRAVAQEFNIGAYGAIEYNATRTVDRATNEATNNNGFRLASLDLFLRGSAGNWSFLSEILFDVDEGNEIAIDLDRFQLTYEVGDWLKITGGRFHTSLGYYNTAYPQGGAVYLLPMDRPELVDQHDNRSILPASTVGLNFHGRLPFLQQRFSYDLDVANGRGIQSDDLANGGDLNNQKMFNLRLRYELNGLIIGANALVDWIPPRVGVDPATDQPDTLREQIFGAHIAYVEHPWHLIAEGYHISHIGPNQTQRTLAGLAEVGYTINQITPYARYEFARFPSPPDVFWLPTFQATRGSYNAVSAGIKVIANENFAVKIEGEWNRGETDTEYRAGTQVAFGF